MKYFLESGPSLTPKNAEGLLNLPSQNRDGGWSVVSELNHFPKNGPHFFFQFSTFPLETTDKTSLVCISFSLKKTFNRKIKKEEEKTGVEPCPHFA